MSNDPADKLAAPSFGFKKKRGGAKPAKATSEETPTKAQPETAETKTQVLEETPPPVAAEPPAATEPPAAKTPKAPKAPKPAKAAKEAKAADKPQADEPKAAKPAKAAKPTKPAKAPKPAKPAKTPKPAKDPKQRRLKIATPSGLAAAIMIGAIVGAFMAVAVWFSGAVSQWTRGTSSLGGSGGFVLVAVFALAVVVGGYLLRLASARSPFTISFLGSGLVAVLSMLFLTEVFAHTWGVIVIVLLTAAAYALAHWITTSYID